MKKVKRFLAVFMSAVILLGTMAFSSFAASGIQSVDISLDVAPGVDISDWEEYLTLNTSGVKVIDSFDSYQFLVFDSNYNLADGEFEIGNDYYFEFMLELEEGYRLPGSEFEFEGVTINGEGAEYYLWYEDTADGNDVIYVCYYISIGGPISEIDLTVDVYGDMIKSNYYRFIKMNSNGMYFYYGNFHPINIIDSEGNSVDVFVSGETYTLEIFFEPKENCNFAKDSTGAFALESVTVNGEDAEYYIDSYTTNGYYEYVKIVTQVTAKTPSYINSIAIGIDTDLTDVSVGDWEDYVTIHTEGIVFEDYLGDPAVWAVNATGDSVETFKKGDVYNLYICFRAEDGYFFPGDETFDSLMVNGEENGNYYFSSYIASDGEEIYYLCIENYVDLVGDSFIDQIIYFFRMLFYNISSFFSGLFFGEYYY